MEERDVWRHRSYLDLYSGGRGYMYDHREEWQMHTSG